MVSGLWGEGFSGASSGGGGEGSAAALVGSVGRWGGLRCGFRLSGRGVVRRVGCIVWHRFGQSWKFDMLLSRGRVGT